MSQLSLDQTEDETRDYKSGQNSLEKAEKERYYRFIRTRSV